MIASPFLFWYGCHSLIAHFAMRNLRNSLPCFAQRNPSFPVRGFASVLHEKGPDEMNARLPFQSGGIWRDERR